jgi:hypothetical protein
VMGIDASYKSDLLHIEAIIATLERMARTGEGIASTSVINDPDYWRRRIEMMLDRQDLSRADRKHAQAVKERLHGIVHISSERRETEK